MFVHVAILRSNKKTYFSPMKNYQYQKLHLTKDIYITKYVKGVRVCFDKESCKFWSEIKYVLYKHVTYIYYDIIRRQLFRTA